jgi:hypothetical protein
MSPKPSECRNVVAAAAGKAGTAELGRPKSPRRRRIKGRKKPRRRRFRRLGGLPPPLRHLIRASKRSGRPRITTKSMPACGRNGPVLVVSIGSFGWDYFKMFHRALCQFWERSTGERKHQKGDINPTQHQKGDNGGRPAPAARRGPADAGRPRGAPRGTVSRATGELVTAKDGRRRPLPWHRPFPPTPSPYENTPAFPHQHGEAQACEKEVEL